MEKTLQVTICLQCGDKGFANAFVYCVNCLDFAVHRYCLDKLPETLDEFIRWFCEDCKPKTVKQSPLRDSVSQQLSDACRKLESTELAITSPLKVKSETEKDNALLPPESNIELDLIEWAQLTEDCCSPIRVKLKNKKRRRRIKKKKKQVSRSVAETVEQRHLSSSALRPCEEFDLTLCAEVAGNSSPLKIEWRKSEDVSKSVAETEKLEHPNSPLLRVEESRKIGEEGESVRVDVSKSVAETEKLEHPNSPLLRVEERRKIGEEGESVRVDASQTVSGDISDMLVSCAQPIIDPIWRGSFSIHNKNDWMFDGIVAHLSNKACPQVCEEASLLPALVCPEMLPKSDVWPKRFEREEPNDDNIALYFFPENKRCEEGFDRLVGEMMCQELAMRAMVKNAELLVFPSTKLPELYWKFKGKYYLWGVFRSKQEASSDPADHQLNIPNGKNECFGHLNSRNDMDSADMRKITKANTWDTRSPLSPLSDNDSTSIALGTKITKHKWPEHPGQLEADLEDHPRLCPEHGHVSSINKNNENNHGNDNETLGPQVRDKLLERFRALQPESFAGVAEPWQAEQWLHQMDLIFETMECNDIEKRQLATFQLTYAAADWWDVVRGTIGEDAVRRMTWMSFKMKFLERYFPTMERNRKEWEFIDLIQGNMSVLEYTNQFERCSRFAPYMVDTTEKKIQKYTQGLIPSIRSWMIGHLNQPFETLVEMAINLEDYWINNRQFQHQTQQGPSPGKKLANNTQGQKRFRNGERKPNPAPQRNHPKSTKGQTDGPSGLCFNCGVPGHISKNCRAPKTKSRREVKCFNCGKLGHISRHCRAPRKNNNAPPTQEQARVCAVFPNGAGVDEVKQYGLEGEHEHGRELNSDGR